MDVMLQNLELVIPKQGENSQFDMQFRTQIIEKGFIKLNSYLKKFDEKKFKINMMSLSLMNVKICKIENRYSNL